LVTKTCSCSGGLRPPIGTKLGAHSAPIQVKKALLT